MARPKHPVRRRIWRVTPEAPMGEFVDLGVAPPTGPPAPSDPALRDESADSNWLQSSFDLAIGLDVQDFEDTVPGEFFDDLFSRKPT